MILKRSILGLLVLTAFVFSGCRKPPPPPAVVVHPTPTPQPDADAIVYMHDSQLWMMKWDGSGAGILASSPHLSFWFPAASPRGDDVLAWISRPDNTMDVARVTLDGKYEILTSIGESAEPPMEDLRLGNAPSYDSKGDQIAYSFNGNIWIMNRDGYNAETIVSDGLSYSPVWSPDDKKIAYINGKDEHYDLWVTDVTSHDTWQVTDFKEYSVGQPCWSVDGKRVILTRIQEDQSNLVEVLAETDVPLVDADMITRDTDSASARLNKEGTYIAFSSAGPPSPDATEDTPSPAWDIWTSDAAGKEPKKISTGGGSSPAWIRPSVPSAVVAMPVTTLAPTWTAHPAPAGSAPAMANVPSSAAPLPSAAARPTPLPTRAPISTSAPAPFPMQPKVQVPPPMAQSRPSSPASSGVAGQSATRNPAPNANANPGSAASPAQARPSTVQLAQSKPAPTQSPVKAPPLRMRMRVSFDPDNDNLVLSSLVEITKIAHRVKQYSGETITVYGPLDRSPLRGLYASEDERSQIRAQQVSEQLAKAADLPANSIASLPYTPVVIGATTSNGIEIHIELKQ